MKHLILVLLCVFSMKAFAGELRGAFDIGSGATKLVVAEVDKDAQKIVKTLYVSYDKKDSVKVAYQEILNKSLTNELDGAILEKGKNVILALKAEAIAELKAKKISDEDIKNIKWVGVTTGAFRKALNGAASAKQLARQTEVPVYILSAADEGKLGFLSALNGLNNNAVTADNLLVWDIGGSTQQFVYYEKSDEGKDPFHIYSGNLASESFKNALVKEFKKEGNTPNPIGHDGVEFGKKYLTKIKTELPEGFKDKIENEKTVVVGIGGVHAISVKNQVLKKDAVNPSYTSELIDSKLPDLISKTDKEIGGAFAATDVSNLILVSGQMEALNIKKVSPLKVTLVEGALLKPDYWK